MDKSHLQFSHTYRVPRRSRQLTKHLQFERIFFVPLKRTSICRRGLGVSVTATIHANFPQGRAFSEVSTQILWSLYSSQVCGTIRLSVSSTQSFEATSLFSCFSLKKVIGTRFQIQTNLPKLVEEGSIWLQPEAVLDQRECCLHQRTIKEVLVQWKDTTLDATWESTTILQ